MVDPASLRTSPLTNSGTQFFRRARGYVPEPLALASEVAIVLDEQAIPVHTEVRGACEILGLDPLTIANDGRLLAVVTPEAAETALAARRAYSLGQEAAIIGSVQAEPEAMVFLRTDIGGKRVLDMLVGDPFWVLMVLLFPMSQMGALSDL